MKTKFLLSFLALSVFTLAANKPRPKAKFTPGTYGVCSCNNSSIESLSFSFTLHADNTFRYVDKTSNKDVKGKWELKGHSIILSGFDDKDIDKNWNLDQGGKCIKSRKGLAFTRICNLELCK